MPLHYIEPATRRMPGVAQGIAQSLMQYQERQRAAREQEQIRQIMQSGDMQTMPGRKKVLGELWKKLPTHAERLMPLFAQQDATEMAAAAKGQTQGPAAQVYIADDGSAYQLSREQGTAVAVPYTLEDGAQLPKSTKSGTKLFDEDGNVVIQPHGSNKVIPLTTEAGKAVRDPGVKLGQAEFGLKTRADARAEEMAKQERVAVAQKYKAVKMKYSGQISQLDEVVDLASSLAKNKALSGTTGLGRPGAFIPGTAWANAEADRKRLVSIGAINTMAALKAESPTGSTGFGALSENELKTLQNAWSSLANTNVSPTKLRKELDRIVNTITAYKTRLQNFENEYQIPSEQSDDPLDLGL